MKDEIKEILMNKEFGDGKYYQLTTELTINEWNKLLDYITNLQQKIDQYENPDDLTLFYMWLDTKAKDKMKELETINTSLKQTNAMLSLLGGDYKSRCENAKIYIKEHSKNLVEYLDVFEVKDLLEILEEGEEKLQNQ